VMVVGSLLASVHSFWEGLFMDDMWLVVALFVLVDLLVAGLLIPTLWDVWVKVNSKRVERAEKARTETNEAAWAVVCQLRNYPELHASWVAAANQAERGVVLSGMAGTFLATRPDAAEELQVMVERLFVLDFAQALYGPMRLMGSSEEALRAGSPVDPEKSLAQMFSFA
jgi:hypothetical protein